MPKRKPISETNSPKKIKSESSSDTPRKKIKREPVEVPSAQSNLSPARCQPQGSREKQKLSFAEKLQTCLKNVLRMEQEHPDTWPLLPLANRITRDSNNKIISIDWEGCYLDMLFAGEDFGEDEFHKKSKEGKKVRVQRSLKGTQSFDHRQIGKTSWDLLLEEMTKVSSDFASKRNTRKSLLSRICKELHRPTQQKVVSDSKMEAFQRRGCAQIARIIKDFWGQIGKIATYRHNAKLEEVKNIELKKHLNKVVGETEHLSVILAKDLKNGDLQQKQDSTLNELLTENKMEEENDDNDDVKEMDLSSESDDEETIAEAETAGDNIFKSATEEEEKLKKEQKMSIEAIMKEYQKEKEEQGINSDISSDNEEEEEEEQQQIADRNSDEEPKHEDGTPNGAQKEGNGREFAERAAASAQVFQPTGTTLSTTTVKTPIPFLLQGTLREYQHIGLDWLVALYEKHLNGILADEMGLGKTVMTIALLAHLAVAKADWGPHLIIVPSSLVVNWELEFKRWCPSFKLLVYFGTPKERQAKRAGWSKPDAFHVCITSYRLVTQDQAQFRRQRWSYMILDEAQNIKNFKSQRWLALLNFHTRSRLLLTGTPLQNSVMELWSLMHFLMPNVFQSHAEFQQWFSTPLTQAVESNSNSEETRQLIQRLHAILRPFILRRMKRDVEKQLPPKVHHTIYCSLSRRQQYLYEEFISSSETQNTLKGSSFFGIVGVLMQLRKVCNHPDLFAERPIESPLDCGQLTLHFPGICTRIRRSRSYALLNPQSDFYLKRVALQESTQQKAHRTGLIQVRVYDNGKWVWKDGWDDTTWRASNDDEQTANQNAKLQGQDVPLRTEHRYQAHKQQQDKLAKSTAAFDLSDDYFDTPLLYESPLDFGLFTTNGSVFSQEVDDGIIPTRQQFDALFTAEYYTEEHKKYVVGPANVNGEQEFILSPIYVHSPPGISMPPPPLSSSIRRYNALASRENHLIEEVKDAALARFNHNKLLSLREELFPGVRSDLLRVKTTQELLSSTPSDITSYFRNKGKFKIGRRDSSTFGSNMGEDVAMEEPDTISNEDDIICPSMISDEETDDCNTNCCPDTSLNCENEPSKTCTRVDVQLTDDCLTLLEMKSSKSSFFHELFPTLKQRISTLSNIVNNFCFRTQPVRASTPLLVSVNSLETKTLQSRKGSDFNCDSMQLIPSFSSDKEVAAQYQPVYDCLDRTFMRLYHQALVRQSLRFPDKRLLQYDCGKLRALATLLRKLADGGHRALIFTQMTRMLDILESFINLHHYTYARLDGATKLEQRQLLIERFNSDKRIFLFLLSTRSGGFGLNLTGADTVIFYDSDWNPAMDAQAQDRCHRIGQTREVHIYRLVTSHTIEENIVKKAAQKRQLNKMVIKDGGFTTDFFKNLDLGDLINTTGKKRTYQADEREVIERDDSDAERENPNDLLSQQRQQELESILSKVEDASDVAALKTAKKELYDENIVNDFNDKEAEKQINDETQDDPLLKELNPLQRYALHFVEKVCPIFDEKETKEFIRRTEEEFEKKGKQLQLDSKKRLAEIKSEKRKKFLL